MKKSILIFSQQFDTSTDEVMDWLWHAGANFTRLNSGDPLLEVNGDINNDDLTLKFGSHQISLRDVSAYWHRRGHLSIPHHKDWANENLKGDSIVEAITDEEKVITNYLLHALERLPSLGGYFTKSPNKLQSLHRAKQAGLEIPQSQIICTKKALAAIPYPIITKPFFETITFQLNGRGFGTFTESISAATIENLPEVFFPVFVQEQLNKSYEIRVFYLAGKCYSIALFSQNDDKTKLDFRNYNYSKMNRQSPYALPGDIKQKIDVFMKLSGLDTGSIDFVVTTDERMVFLEVNPVGQFGFVSEGGNYYIEKAIAEHLIQLSNEYGN